MDKKKKIIIFICIVVLFIGSLIGFNLSNTKEDEKLKEPTSEEDYMFSDPPTIDFDNLENVKIEDEKKVNTSKEILKEHTVDYYTEKSDDATLEFDDVSLYADVSQTYFRITVHNNNDFDIDYVSINIAFLNNDGEYIYSNERNLLDLKAGASVELEIDDFFDYSNAKNIEITVA